MLIICPIDELSPGIYFKCPYLTLLQESHYPKSFLMDIQRISAILLLQLMMTGIMTGKPGGKGREGSHHYRSDVQPAADASPQEEVGDLNLSPIRHGQSPFAAPHGQMVGGPAPRIYGQTNQPAPYQGSHVTLAQQHPGGSGDGFVHGEGGERGQPSASVYGTPQIAGLPMHAPLPPAQRLPQAREVVEAALAAWAAQRTAGLTIQMPSGALSPPAHHPTAAATVAASSLGPRRRIGKSPIPHTAQIPPAESGARPPRPKVTIIESPQYVTADAASFKGIVHRLTGKPADASGGQHGIAPSAPVPTTFNPGVDYYRRNDIQGMNIPHYQHDIPAPFVDHSQFHHGAQPQQYPNVENCGKASANYAEHQLASLQHQLGARPQHPSMTMPLNTGADHRGKAIQQDIQHVGAVPVHWQNTLAALFGHREGPSNAHQQQHQLAPMVDGLGQGLNNSYRLEEFLKMVQTRWIEMEKQKSVMEKNARIAGIPPEQVNGYLEILKEIEALQRQVNATQTTLNQIQSTHVRDNVSGQGMNNADSRGKGPFM